jgi:hypothetical protein
VTLRRVGVLIYATAVIYFMYAPWNYVLLGILLLNGNQRKLSVDVAAAPHPQTKGSKAAVCHRPGLFLAVRVAGSAWGVVGCAVNSLRIQKSFRSLGRATVRLLTQERSSTKRVKPSCNWSGGLLALPTETAARRSK